MEFLYFLSGSAAGFALGATTILLVVHAILKASAKKVEALHAVVKDDDDWVFQDGDPMDIEQAGANDEAGEAVRR